MKTGDRITIRGSKSELQARVAAVTAAVRERRMVDATELLVEALDWIVLLAETPDVGTNRERRP